MEANSSFSNYPGFNPMNDTLKQTNMNQHLEQTCRLKALEALDGIVFQGRKEYLKAMVKVTNALLEIALLSL